MKLDSIREKVIGLIEDKGYDPVTIDEKINLALTECCQEADVPDLKKVFTVATSTTEAYVSLREKITRFGGRVKRIKYNGTNLRPYTSLDEMLIDYDDLATAGDVESFCQEGQMLWYAKIPETSANLLVLCYQNPEPLSSSNQEILWMPEHIQYKVLVGGPCGYIFDEKEEEDSGKPVTRRYEKMFADGVVQFKSWISKNKLNLTYSCWTQ